jgi:hypothetical protein
MYITFSFFWGELGQGLPILTKKTRTAVRSGSGAIFFFFFTQKRLKEFTVFEDQPDNRRKEKTSCPNIEDRKRGLRLQKYKL